MSIAEQVQSIARREYALLRTCAQAVDSRLEPAVSSSPGLRTALSRVREVLRNVDDLVAGATQAKQTPMHPEKPRPDTPVSAPRAPAAPSASSASSAPPKTTEDKPQERASDDAAPTEPSEAEVEHLAEEFLDEETDHLTGELADNEDLREVQARLRAKHTLEEQGEQHP